MNINGANNRPKQESHKYFALTIIQTSSLRDIWKFSIGWNNFYVHNMTPKFLYLINSNFVIYHLMKLY